MMGDRSTPDDQGDQGDAGPVLTPEAAAQGQDPRAASGPAFDDVRGGQVDADA